MTGQVIKQQRHVRILSVLRREGAVSLAALSQLLPEVSRVTLRRDIVELAEAGALKRRHGGAVLPDADVVSVRGVTHLVPPSRVDALARADAVILPPVSGRGGSALRRQILRRGIPFLAESAAQEGGAYLGPQNAESGRALGQLAGRAARPGPIAALAICQPELSNTKARSDGFEVGLREAADRPVEVLSVNGQGSFRVALRVTMDALQSRPDIDIAFAVNDHAAQAAIEATKRLGRALAVYAVGGESPEFVGRLAEDGPLRAVCALFPETVGRIGIDRVAAALSGEPLGEAPTPHAVVTPGTLADHYVRDAAGAWTLGVPAGEDIVPARPLAGRTVAFMPHYPAHDWYRTMIAAMRERAHAYGMTLEIIPPHQGIAAERTRLRAAIAARAAAEVSPGQTVVIGQGEAGLAMAGELRRIAFEPGEGLAGVTVITTALDVLDRLADAPGLRTILTAGELQAADRAMVGPAVGALFERMRADVAFLPVHGITAEFGPSSSNERLALAAARCAGAARRVVVLADHMSVGVDTVHRIVRADEIYKIITDDGTPPGERQRFRAAGIDVLAAGDPVAERDVGGVAPARREHRREDHP